MKRVVCREDITAELDMLSDMKLTIQMLQSQVSILQDRLELLEAKTSVINSMNTSVSSAVSASVNVPTRTGDTTYGQSMADLINMRRAAAEAWNEQAQRISDGNWNDISNSNNN